MNRIFCAAALIVCLSSNAHAQTVKRQYAQARLCNVSGCQTSMDACYTGCRINIGGPTPACEAACRDKYQQCVEWTCAKR
jgi:hypothetical protein